MQKIILFFSIVMVSFSSLSQTIARLGKNNGFKKFILGTELSNIPNIKQNRTYANKKDYKNYIYTGTDIMTFSGIRIYKIELNFYKNKLFQISLRMDQGKSEYTEIDYEIATTTLEANFGKNNAICQPLPTSLGKSLNCAIWDGKNVRLEHSRVFFTDIGVIIGTLLFTEKNIQQQQELDELN